jgi:hypothetical protein
LIYMVNAASPPRPKEHRRKESRRYVCEVQR